MGWLDDFKAQKGDDPQDRYEDEVLGLMSWSPDDEAWAGEHCGLRFLIAFERQPTPTKDLLAYAREMLADLAQFIGAIDRAKSTAIAENPRLADEIAGLRAETVHFYEHKGHRRIITDLSGGMGDRSWRVEFLEKGCEGIGFDT